MNKFKLSFLVLFLCCLSSFVFATNFATDNTEWWTLQTSQTEGLKDQSINEHNLTSTGSTYTALENAFTFTTIGALTSASINFNQENTHNFWIKGNMKEGYILDYATADSNSDRFSFNVLAGGEIRVFIRGAGGENFYRDTSDPINSNQWEMVTVVFDSDPDQLNIYVNGTLNQGELIGTTSEVNLQTTLNIGQSISAGSKLTGLLSGISIFDITLNSAEISDLYAEGRDYDLYSINTFTISPNNYGGYQLLNYNATVNGTNYNTTTGTIITDLNQTGIVNISITASNNNSDLTLSYLDYNLSNNLLFNYSVLEVTANNSRTGLPISTFTTTINDTLNQTSQENKTYYYLTNGTYNLNVSPIGYNYNVTTLILPLGLTELVSEHYAKESVLINIFNATSGLRLNETNVSIQLELNDNITLANTSTGELFLSNLTTGQYQFRFYADDFENTYYEVDIDSNSFQILNVYMTETTPLEVVFTVKKKNTVQVIENVIVSIKKLVGVEWVLVNSLITDLSGKVTFSYENNLRYKFVVTADGYDTKSFELNPIIFSSYNIFMDTNIEVNTPNSHKLSVSYSPGIYYNNKNNTFAVIFSSPTGSLEYYDYTITFKNTSLSDSGNNAYGEELTDVLEILNSSFGDQLFLEYRYLLTGNDMQTVTLSYFVSDPDAEGFTFLDVGNSYGMGLLERVAIITILLLLVGGVAYLFGGVVTSTVSSLLILGYFLFLNFVSGWIIIPTMLFLFLVLIGGSFK